MPSIGICLFYISSFVLIPQESALGPREHITAKAVDDQRAIEELSRVGPPPYESSDGFRVQHKWANAFEGADEFLYGTIGLTLVALGNSVQDVGNSVQDINDYC
jgi:hypothetical protein